MRASSTGTTTCDPAGAADPVDAITYMNYVYDPQVAAALADYIWYVSPVPAAQEVSWRTLADGPGGRSSPLVFPDQAMYAKTHQYYVFKDIGPERVEQHLRPDHHGLAAATPGKVRLGRRLAPYGLTGPGALWLVVFFLIPMFAMLVLSLETPLPTVGFKQAGSSSPGTSRSTRRRGPSTTCSSCAPSSTPASSPRSRSSSATRSRTGSRSRAARRRRRTCS